MPDGQISCNSCECRLDCAAGSPSIGMRAKGIFLRRFNLIWVVQWYAQKHFAFHRPQIGGYSRHPGFATRGVSRSSRHVRRDAVDAMAHKTNAAIADGEVVWF